MIPNKVKQAWAEGRPVVNGWLGIGSAFAAEIMAEAGFDSLTVDVQHGFFDYSDARAMLQAIRASGVTPLARVPWREPGAIMKLLDAGAYGIICPMVNNAREAAELVSYVRYPPLGTRSYGPIRANLSAGANYAAEANDQILVLAMIETKEAYDNVAEICATPGIDGVYIGPADLTLGLSDGRLAPGQDREEPEMVEAIRHIADTAKAAGIGAAIHTGGPDYATKAIGWGFGMTTIAADSVLLTAGSKAVVRDMRARLGQGDDAAPETSSGY